MVELISDLFDEPALIAQFKRVGDSLDTLQQKIVDMNGANKANKGADLSGFVAGTEKLATATEELTQASNKAKTANENLVKSAKEVIQFNEKLDTTYGGLSGSIEDNIRLQLSYKSAMDQMKASQKALDAAYKSGQISAEDYGKSLTDIGVSTAAIKQQSTELTRTIRLQAKEQLATAGSVDQLGAKYDRLWQVFRGLSAEEANSDFGKQLQVDLNDLSTQINETSKDAGNFWKNVGRYSGSLAKPFESLINKLDELKANLNQGIGLGGGTDQESLNKSAIAINAIEKGLQKAGKETSTANVQVSALTKTLTTLTLTADQSDTGMQSFLKDLTHEVGQAKDAVGDLNDEIKLEASDTKGIDNVVGSLNALAGIAQGAAGAYALFGASEEDAAVITSKLIAVQGIANSVQQVGAELTRKGTIANKAYVFVQGLVATVTDVTATATARLNAVLKLSTIGLVVAAIGGLVYLLTRAAPELREFVKQMKISNDLMGESKGEYVKATLEVSNLKTAFHQAKEGIITKDAAVKLYNETIGKTTGQVKTLDEAEKALGKNADAYVLFTMKKAVANLAAAKAAEKSLDIQLAAAEPQFKATVSGSSVIDPISKLREDKEKKARDKRINAAFSEEVTLLKIQKDAQIEADEIAKKFKFNPLGNTESAKAAKESKEVQDKTAEDILRSNFELQKNIIQSSIDANKKIVDDEKASYDERLQALRMFNASSIALLDLQMQFDIDSEDLKLKETLKALELQKKEKGANVKEINKVEENEKKASALRVRVIEDNNFQALKKIGEGYLNDRKDLLNKQYQQQVEFDQQFIDLEKDTQKQIKDAKDKAIEAEKERQKKLSDLQKSGENDLKERTKELYNELRETIVSFINDSFEKEKNSIQERIDLTEEEKNKKIESVNQQSISEQEKADKIAVINATAQVEKERLEARKRKIDIEQARFAKAAAAAQIIQSTALAIIEVLAKYKGTPVAFSLAATIGAIGALQLARTLATPIPKYRHGRGYGKDELAITNDGTETEYIHRGKTGNVEKVLGKNTLTYLNAEDRVFKSREEMLRELAMGSMGGRVVTINDGLSKKDIQNLGNRIEDAVSSISFHHTTITKEGWRETNEKIRGYDKWVDKNIRN